MGSPILSGTYSGPVAIPTGGAEFLALLVLKTGTAPPPPPPPPPPPTDTIEPNTMFTTTSVCGTTITTNSVTLSYTGTDNVTPTASLVYRTKVDSQLWSVVFISNF